MASWNRSKIMLVGQGRAGKTALARSMMGEPFRETPSTIGGELFEREIREGNVKGGKLAEFKRPEKELEWMIARNGIKYAEKSRKRPRFISSLSALFVSEAPSGMFGLCNVVQENESNITTTSKQSPNTTGRKRSICNGGDLDRDTTCKLITENINIRKNISNLTISLCDFGGQEVFNALHAFFMTRCGVYILVFEMELFLSKVEKDRESCHENIKFWMNSIAMHTYDEKTGKTAPVALVGTRGDRVSSLDDHEMISSELKTRYENHRSWPSLIVYRPWRYDNVSSNNSICFFPINNSNSYSKGCYGASTLEYLLEDVECRIEESEDVEREIPVIWMKVLDEIREKGKKENNSFVLLEEVTEIGKELGISLEGVSELLRYLSEMGVLIWIEEPGLREIVILDPIEYFVKPVTRII
jgi:GTPase SAR1 family protein